MCTKRQAIRPGNMPKVVQDTGQQSEENRLSVMHALGSVDIATPREGYSSTGVSRGRSTLEQCLLLDACADTRPPASPCPPKLVCNIEVCICAYKGPGTSIRPASLPGIDEVHRVRRLCRNALKSSAVADEK